MERLQSERTHRDKAGNSIRPRYGSYPYSAPRSGRRFRVHAALLPALAPAYSITFRSRSALVTTDTELIAMAAPAKMGDSSSPKKG